MEQISLHMCLNKKILNLKFMEKIVNLPKILVLILEILTFSNTLERMSNHLLKMDSLKAGF